MLGMWLAIFCYLKRLKLVLLGDKIIYQKMWWSVEIKLSEIKSIKRGHGPFRTGVIWIIQPKTHNAPILANVTNFDHRELHDFAKVLLQKQPGISFSALPLS